ncbi:hypothetical protein VCS63_23460 [Achromobacter sp. D10]|uniref:hypothetical protein n=1 Tax=Achromobacter sp. D10 TaxID=3110765 RepID=UPI002B4A3D80|nr:hypothetical protein [Achromobacter sp. D10]MEB3098814.1 hypothetical protein [Achromobacter sp. D10]
MNDNPVPASKYQFLTLHPFYTYGQPNEGRIFKARGGKEAQQVGRPHGDNPDTAALWRLGERAYSLLQPMASVDQFDAELAEFNAFLDDARRGIYASIVGGTIHAVTPDGGDANPDWIKDLPESQILDMCWGMGTAKGPISDEFLADMFRTSFCLAALIEIENAYIGMFFDGRDAVSSALAAAEAIFNAETIANRTDRMQEARRQIALQGALSRLQNDPRQREKQFIKDCWREWKNDPSRYASKAAFARDMLTKCSHLQSSKKIEDWTRQWDQE